MFLSPDEKPVTIIASSPATTSHFDISTFLDEVI